MSLDFLNGCKFTTSAAGNVDWPVTGAATGFLTPAQAGAVSGNTYRYRAQNATMTEWEIGTGTYTTVGGATLVRTTVLFSSTGSKVAFTAAPEIGITFFESDFALPGGASGAFMTKASTADYDTQWLTTTAVRALLGVRTRLAANLSLYVSHATGNDTTGDGLTSLTPWKTGGKAMAYIRDTLDVAGFTVTVNFADSTSYNTVTNIEGWVGGGIVEFVGNVTTPANVQITTSGYGFAAEISALSGIVRIRGFTFSCSSSAIITRVPGRVQMTACRFLGGCTADMICAGNAAVLEPYGNFEIVSTGGARTWCMLADSQGQISWVNADLPSAIGTITLTGIPSAVTAWLYFAGNSTGLLDGGTFSGTAVGSQFNVVNSSNVRRSSGAFPGNSGGTTSTGGNVNGYTADMFRSVSAATTCVLTDRTLVHPAADTTARIWTIPANSSVAYQIGTKLYFHNENGAGALTISITTDTMRMVNAGIVGSFVLPGTNGGSSAVATKITATTWQIETTAMLGRTDASAVPSGTIGEYLEIAASAVGMGANTPTNLTSLSIPAGDWDIWGVTLITPGTAGSVGYVGLTTSTATLPAAMSRDERSLPSTAAQSLVPPCTRFNFSATTTVYMVAQCSVAGTGTGSIRARRAS